MPVHCGDLPWMRRAFAALIECGAISKGGREASIWDTIAVDHRFSVTVRNPIIEKPGGRFATALAYDILLFQPGGCRRVADGLIVAVAQTNARRPIHRRPRIGVNRCVTLPRIYDRSVSSTLVALITAGSPDCSAVAPTMPHPRADAPGSTVDTGRNGPVRSGRASGALRQQTQPTLVPRLAIRAGRSSGGIRLQVHHRKRRPHAPAARGRGSEYCPASL